MFLAGEVERHAVERQPGQDLVGERPRVEVLPRQGELLPDDRVGAPFVGRQLVQGGLAADAGGGVERRHRLGGRQFVRGRQQIEHHRPGGGQAPRVLTVLRRDQRGRPARHLRPYRRVQRRGVLHGRRRQQVVPTAQLRALVPDLYEPPQQIRPLAVPGVPHRHAQHVVPLVVPAVLDEQVEVFGLHGGLGAQIILEGAVDEVHRVGGGLAQQPAAQQKVAEDLLGGFGRSHLRHRRQLLADDTHGARLRRLRTPVADQPVGDPLEQLDLRLLGGPHALGDGDLPLLVAAYEQHGECGRVHVHPALGQLGVAVPVECADQGAHQRVGGDPVQVGLVAQSVAQRRTEPLDLVPFLG